MKLQHLFAVIGFAAVALYIFHMVTKHDGSMRP
jgi:hypothetical protein